MTQVFSATAPIGPGAVLITHLGSYNFETGVLAASQSIVPGTVLGRITSGGQLVVVNPTATDGSQNFAGIAMEARTTIAGETLAITFLDRGPAEVAEQYLTFPAGITSPQRATLRAAILAANIKLR